MSRGLNFLEPNLSFLGFSQNAISNATVNAGNLEVILVNLNSKLAKTKKNTFIGVPNVIDLNLSRDFLV